MLKKTVMAGLMEKTVVNVRGESGGGGGDGGGDGGNSWRSWSRTRQIGGAAEFLVDVFLLVSLTTIKVAKKICTVRNTWY